MKEGGIMAIHDTIQWPGPKKAVEEYVFKSKEFKNVGFVDSITFGEKVEHNTLKDRLKNRYILLLKRMFELRTKLNMPLSLRIMGKKVFRLMQV
jgi:hypothetical protein